MHGLRIFRRTPQRLVFGNFFPFFIVLVTILDDVRTIVVIGVVVLLYPQYLQPIESIHKWHVDTATPLSQMIPRAAKSDLTCSS